MRAPLRVVCRPEVAVGFALTGLAVEEVADGEAVEALLEALADTPGAGGLLLIEDQLVDELGPAVMRRVRKRGMPILVPFPAPSLAGERERAADEEVLDILRRAVGYRLRLR